MKSTKIMLAILATLLITWCVIGTIGYLLSDDTFKQSMSSGGTFFFMILFGWIPCIIIGADLDKSLE
jgi:FtsH-binding integral membrane protein